MKKETTIIATVEITKVMKNFSFENKTLEETKQDVKNSLTNHIKKDDWFNADNVNVCDVKIFELKKEERISTEDLIKAAKECVTDDTDNYPCENCIFDGANCKSNLVEAVADRLEELNNQQKVTPKEMQATRLGTINIKTGDNFTVCSNCKAEFPLTDETFATIQDININYCYHCGAKFKDGDEE